MNSVSIYVYRNFEILLLCIAPKCGCELLHFLPNQCHQFDYYDSHLIKRINLRVKIQFILGAWRNYCSML